MAFFYSSLTVANIAAAKALNASTTPKRVDGLFLAIADTGSGFPGWYRYSAASALAENLPKVFRSNDDVGAWLQFSGGDDGGGSTPLQFISTNYTAVRGDRLLVVLPFDSEDPVDITITLPASPQPGDEIEILYRNDYGADAGLNFPRAYLNPSGKNFIGDYENTIYLTRRNNTTNPVRGLGGKIVYVSEAIGWYPLPPAAMDAFLYS